MPTDTTKLKLQKPIVNSATDADQWGDILNDDLDDLDSLIPTTTVTKTASFSISATEFNYLYLVDASSGAITIDLPASVDVYNGFVATIKATNADNTITVDGDLAETIDGNATITLDNTNDVVRLVCDGSNWQLVVRVPDAAESINYASNSVSNAGTSSTASLVPSNFGAQQAKSTNGYQRLPGGILIQWGTYTNSTSVQSHSFPIAFNTVYNIQATVNSDPSAAAEHVTIQSAPTTTSFTGITYLNNAGSGGVTYNILAIGT